MSENAIIMKREIRTLAQYRSLMISRHFLTVLLSITAFWFAIFNYNMAPLYTVLLLNAFPPVLSYAISDYAKKTKLPLLISITKEDPFLLNNLKKRYHYSRIKHLSNSVTYLIAMLFLALWQYNFSTKAVIPFYLEKLPVILLCVGLLLRLSGIPCYRFKLHYDLTHNRVK